MRLVVDASVALKWFLATRPTEHNIAEARAVIGAIGAGGNELFAPPHWMLEVIAVLARIDPSIVDEAILFIDDMRPVLVDSVVVLKRAAELSAQLNQHLFDTLYHAVALEHGATLVTADEAYFARAKDLGSITRLADFAV